MSILKVNPESYSEVHSEDSIQNNWAAVYAKSEIDNHRDTAVIDHPDGSVTKAKLADEVNAIISKAEKDADTAVNTANTAVNTANAATATANTATATAYTAVATADTAAAKSEAAQQRAISADTKSDAAVSSASVAVQKAESVQSDLSEHISDTNIHTSAEEKETLNNGITSAHQYADRAYSLAQDARLLAGRVDANLTEHSSDTNIHTTAEEKQNLDARLTSVESGKVNKTSITNSTDTALSFEFAANYNTEIRSNELTSISFTFGNGEYAQDYMSGLSFDSGETPTAIDYTDSGILNWVGTDCTIYDGLSIFQPSENTHYDIVLYFNGTQFIGLVNGFVPSTGNEAV